MMIPASPNRIVKGTMKPERRLTRNRLIRSDLTVRI